MTTPGFRVYEPPADTPNVREVETVEGVDGKARQVMDAQGALLEALVDLANDLKTLTTELKTAVQALTKPADSQKTNLDPATYNFVTDSTLQQVQAGNAWITGSRLALASGQIGHFFIGVPANQPVAVTLLGFVFYSDVAVRMRFREDVAFPSGGTLITPMNANQAFQGVKTSLAVGRIGVNIVTGGQYLPIESRLNGQSVPSPFEFPIIIPPGQNFTAEVTAPTGLGASADVAATAIYLEHPVG